MVLTVGYALFQTANNTAVMRDVIADQRGVVAGLLSLSRNPGLVTGASAMGAVFALSIGAGSRAFRVSGAATAALLAWATAQGAGEFGDGGP